MRAFLGRGQVIHHSNPEQSKLEDTALPHASEEILELMQVPNRNSKDTGEEDEHGKVEARDLDLPVAGRRTSSSQFRQQHGAQVRGFARSTRASSVMENLVYTPSYPLPQFAHFVFGELSMRVFLTG